MTGVDPEIASALGLDGQTATMRAHGGSGFSSTFKVTGRRADADENAPELQYFVKTGAGQAAEVMFRGEYASLNAIADAVPDFCPRAHAHGPLRDRPGRYFLATDFLELGGHSSGGGAGSGRSFAAKLAELHSQPVAAGVAPPDAPFGFPVTTCCGATEQDNTWAASWADFYANNRLRHILRAGQRSNGADPALAEAVEQTASVVVPRLLRDGHLRRSARRGGGNVVPVVVHGDLWSGNHGRGRIVTPAPAPTPGRANPGVEEVVYDPACVYGHSEYELGIMRMFGGFHGGFWREYEQLVPKDEPVDEWEDRVALYELYHHLNHYALFGGGYRGGAMSIMRGLLSKYG